MMTTLTHFFLLNGYGYYVWPAYLVVIICLLLQWYFPWRRWKKFLTKK